VLLSDGGHIENLGVFELLRRRCRLIFVVDASADPDFGFQDLKELVIQARNILGLKIDFATRPEEVIRPDPSYGFSQEHFAIAKVSDLKGADVRLKDYQGLMVYIKSSQKAPNEVGKRKKYENYNEVGEMKKNVSYLYKTWHPAFPHESTADQFFDEPQWDAYYTLGKDMAEEVLKHVLGNQLDTTKTRQITSKQWYAAFESKWKK
jgi:hypothetical protein